MHDERVAWLRRIEAFTVDFREEKALALEAEARRRKRKAKLAGEDERKAGKWHRNRAQGQRYRFSNAINCGNGPNMLRATCEACGNVTDHPLSCGATLVCISCRGKLQAERRAQVGAGQRIIMHRAKKLGLVRQRRKGGRWGDKFITLTIPHLREHDVAARVSLVNEAWPHFLKAINKWLRTVPMHDGERALVTWYGSFEWTAGSDGQGHPHVQLWYFGPFIEPDLSELWRAALEKAGLGEPVAGDDGRTHYRWEGDVITDVRDASRVKGGIYELIKYVVKDIVADGAFVGAELYGQLFQALHGRRLRRGSKGFIALCETPIPCACGETECYSTKVVERTYPADLLERECIELEERGPP